MSDVHPPPRDLPVSVALRQRRSIRAFLPTPVPEQTLHALLADALEAPSWGNTQPFRVALVHGAACDAMRQALVEAARTRVPAADFDLLFDSPPELLQKKRATGFGLYAALGIGRDDKAGRAVQWERNFAMFDAPAACFLFVHEAPGPWAALDLGCFLQSLLLAATARGLGTCAQAVLGSFPDIVRGHFEVGPQWKLMCGVAIGHPDPNAPANTFRPPRMALDELLLPPRAPLQPGRPPDGSGPVHAETGLDGDGG